MRMLPMYPSLPTHRVAGPVVHGRKLGRRLGFPTANLRLAAGEGPPFGVYAVLARVEDRWHAASASWGTRPHFDDGEPLLEVHLIDFAAELYGCDIEVEFMAKLREEQVFSSTAALRAQIAADIRATRALLDPVLRERERLGDADGEMRSPAGAFRSIGREEIFGETFAG